jgi:hypothetical protein
VTIAAAAALLGWILLVVLAELLGRGLGWGALGAVMPPLAFAALYARAKGLGTLAAIGLTFVLIVVEWPLLYVIALLIFGPGEET